MMTKPPRPVSPRAPGSWTKQLVSFGASFAFFGLAGFLQNGSVFDQETAVAALTDTQPESETTFVSSQTTPDVDSSEISSQELEDPEWLGPVQPLPVASADGEAAATASPASTQAPAPTPAPTPAPVEVDAHTGGS